jgi:hypothetical protein
LISVGDIDEGDDSDDDGSREEEMAKKLEALAAEMKAKDDAILARRQKAKEAQQAIQRAEAIAAGKPPKLVAAKKGKVEKVAVENKESKKVTEKKEGDATNKDGKDKKTRIEKRTARLTKLEAGEELGPRTCELCDGVTLVCYSFVISFSIPSFLHYSVSISIFWGSR